MAERNPRIQYYDCARGIAMILVVASHIWAFNDTRYILFATTHNPTFFFISGSLMAVKATENFRGGVIKKGVSLLLPYVVWVSLYIVNKYRAFDRRHNYCVKRTLVFSYTLYC